MYNLLSSGSDGKKSACKVEDLGLIAGLGKSPGEGNDNPLQYFCLENPMDREAWWATVHGIAKNQDTTERLSAAQPTMHRFIHVTGSVTKHVICSSTFSFPSKMIIFSEFKFIKHHEKTIKMSVL